MVIGRVREFLNQDARQALDRLAVPYARFLTSHKLVMYGLYVAVVALAWVFVSKWLGLAMIAILGVLFLWGLASVVWKRRHT